VIEHQSQIEQNIFKSGRAIRAARRSMARDSPQMPKSRDQNAHFNCAVMKERLRSYSAAMKQPGSPQHNRLEDFDPGFAAVRTR
jgi:hypothetical protein